MIVLIVLFFGREELTGTNCSAVVIKAVNVGALTTKTGAERVTRTRKAENFE